MLIGNPIEGTITCRDQSGALFDPDVVQVTFLKNSAGTIEDVLTYGGSNPRDNQLTRVSVGVYRFWYVTDVVGRWTILPRWTEPTTDPLQPLRVTPDGSVTRDVTASLAQFTDRPAP